MSTNADLGVVFGSGILSAEIISKCPKLLNLHQGAYFRGSAFCTFVLGKLEYVGVTVHQIDRGVDTGGILCHGFPNIMAQHSMHDIGCECIRTSAELVSKIVMEESLGREFCPIPQWSTGGFSNEPI